MKNLLTLIYFSLFIPISSFACYADCTLFSFEKAVEHADEIFIGEIKKAEKLIDYKTVDPYGNEQIFYTWKYYFDVQKKWKGSNQKTVVLFQRENSIALPLDVEHKEYLIYAFDMKKNRDYKIPILKYFKKRKLFAYRCSRTTDEKWYQGKERKFEDEVLLDNYFTNLIPVSNLWKFKNLFLFLSGFFFSISFWKYRKPKFSMNEE